MSAWGDQCQADLARRRVLVVGAGSAGLDAAVRVAASGLCQGTDRQESTLGQNVAPLSASVSASLLAQHVSMSVAPGGLGDPGPLQCLLSSHHLEKLADVTRVNCPVEAAESVGDYRTDLNGRHERAERMRRLATSPGSNLRMLRWIDDRAQAIINWLGHSRIL